MRFMEVRKMEIKMIDYIFPTIGEAGDTPAPENEEGKEDSGILFPDE
jgi:hypothetical protein